MPPTIHYDEAARAIVAIAGDILNQRWLARVAIIDDVFGTFHVLLWLRTGDSSVDLEEAWPAIEQQLVDKCRGFWSGQRFVTNEDGSGPDHEFCETAWTAGHRPAGASDRLRYIDRHRTRTSWFMPLRAQTGVIGPEAQAAPVIAFYSFKGGMGRTTAAAAYVLRQAQAGRRLVAIDLDLDAPGLGRLLGTDQDSAPNPWGTADFLLESRFRYPLTDYRHVCARSELVGDYPVDVFPVGKIDDYYLRKLAKIDLDIHEDEAVHQHPVGELVARIRAELQPDEIVVDCRAGLSPISGFMLSPLADVHVLFSTASDQALDGLTRVVHRLGADRLQAGIPQAECVLVQAMVPESTSGSHVAKSYFNARVEDIYRDHYYQRGETAPGAAILEESTWNLDDLGLAEAPHRAVAIPYREPLADFRDLKEVLSIVDEAPYREVAARIAGRLRGLRDRSDATAESDDF